MNAKSVRRPTFSGLFKLIAPAFAFGILLVLTIQIAFGEFDLYFVPIAIATWLSCVGFLYILTVVLGKLTAPMWDKYEQQQAALSTADEAAEPPIAAQPLIRSVRSIVLIAIGNALVIGSIAGLILGDLLTALAFAIGLGSLAALMWVILWLLFRDQFKQSGMRW
jgi:hypothetical protein